MNSGIEYEHFVMGFLSELGYSSIESTETTGDFGIDILASKDGYKWGFQCKEYSVPVGVSAVQQAIAGKAYYGCDIVGVVTNSTFTKAAQELADVADVMLLGEIEELTLENGQADDDLETRKHYDMNKMAWEFCPSINLYVGWTYGFDLEKIGAEELGNILIVGGGDSGKSTLMNCFLQQLLRRHPALKRVILIDCIGLEYGQYRDFPHLLTNVINTPQKAAVAIEWAAFETAERIKKITSSAARNFHAYNKMMEEKEDGVPMPELYIFIDDAAEALKVTKEEAIRGLMTKGPRVGIYTIISVRSPVMLKEQILKDVYYACQYKAIFNIQDSNDKWISQGNWQMVKRMQQGEFLFYKFGTSGQRIRTFLTSVEQQEDFCARCLNEWRNKLECEFTRIDNSQSPKDEEGERRKKGSILAFLKKRK